MDTSYVTQQITTIIGQLHSLFDEIGVPNHERDSRESELFASLSETLHNHLRLVSGEKNQMIEEAQRIITTISEMEASLDDSKPNNLYAPKDDELKVTYPLLECLELLRAKHKTVSKLHQERYEQVKNLLQALESYSSHLDPSFLQIKLPPVAADGTIPPTFDLSPSYIASVDAEFTRVYGEYTKRVASVQQLAEEIVKLWAELGTPQAQTDTNIVQLWRESPGQLGLHEADMSRLKARRDKLMDEKRGREKRVKDLRSSVESLWERLGIQQSEQKMFNARTRGCGLKVINDLEDELSRLNELKKQNLHLFVEDARAKLQALWDELYISEEEAVEFTPMFCDVFSDALLSAHEAEIARLEVLKEKRAPTLQLIAKHRSLIKDREDLAASSQDASRLMLKPQKGEKRDPTRLLREEKMRKRIAKELPKVEQELVQTLEQWEEEYSRPFYVFGERYLDTIASSSSKAAPPRSKTPNALPAPAKMPRSAGTAPRAPAPREPSTLRSKTPASILTRSAIPSSRAATDNRSPSRIPARMPLGAMTHGGNSPERMATYRTQHGKENGSPARKLAAPPGMAPPPKMRSLVMAEAFVTSTPCSVQAEDFSRSGSIVRHCPPEDPYSDHSSNGSVRRHGQADAHIRTLTQPPTSTHYREMPPPPRPLYRNNMGDATSTTSSVPPSLTSSHGTNSRQISTTSTMISSSENWETYGDDKASEMEPEPDASDAYWRKVRMQQQARGLGTNAAAGAAMARVRMAQTDGVGVDDEVE